MRRRLTCAILLLYPRRVRKGHGPEIAALIDDLIAHERRSRARLFVRLAADGLVQRAAATTTVWTLVAVLAATSLAGLAASDFAAASAHQDPLRDHAHHRAGTTHAPHTKPPPRSRITPRRSARTSARRLDFAAILTAIMTPFDAVENIPLPATTDPRGADSEHRATTGGGPRSMGTREARSRYALRSALRAQPLIWPT